LNGDGGDESFAGYERYFAMQLAEKYHKIPGILRKVLIENAVNLLPTSEIKRSRLRDVKRFVKAASLPKVERYFRWVSAIDRQTKSEIYTEDFRREMSPNNSANVLEKWFDESNGNGIVDATMFTDQQTYLPNDLLVKVDIASMAVSLEARSPFLDHKVIEFAASLPESIKLRGSESKYLLKKAASRLVPREVLYRKKMGFGVPLTHWFRGELKDFIREVLLSEKSFKRGLFHPPAIKKLVNQHINGERDYTHQIWTLLMLELWFQRFID
jgi:asparagine synthase (glutamine-hydrolysing)